MVSRITPGSSRTTRCCDSTPTFPFSRSRNRILLEQAGDHGRVEVGANTDDQGVLEIHDPAVAVVEAHAVPGRRERMKLDHGLIVLDEQMLHNELRALRKNLTQFRES